MGTRSTWRSGWSRRDLGTGDSLFLVGPFWLVFRIDKVDDEWRDPKDLNQISGTVKAKVAGARRYRRVRAHLQLLQLGRIELIAACHPDGALQHRHVLFGHMPMRGHFDLSLGADADHIEPALLVRVAEDDGRFHAGYERLPDELIRRDDVARRRLVGGGLCALRICEN